MSKLSKSFWCSGVIMCAWCAITVSRASMADLLRAYDTTNNADVVHHPFADERYVSIKGGGHIRIGLDVTINDSDYTPDNCPDLPPQTSTEFFDTYCMIHFERMPLSPQEKEQCDFLSLYTQHKWPVGLLNEEQKKALQEAIAIKRKQQGYGQNHYTAEMQNFRSGHHRRSLTYYVPMISKHQSSQPHLRGQKGQARQFVKTGKRVKVSIESVMPEESNKRTRLHPDSERVETRPPEKRVRLADEPERDGAPKRDAPSSDTRGFQMPELPMAEDADPSVANGSLTFDQFETLREFLGHVYAVVFDILVDHSEHMVHQSNQSSSRHGSVYG